MDEHPQRHYDGNTYQSDLSQSPLPDAPATIQGGIMAQNEDTDLLNLVRRIEHLEIAMDHLSMRSSASGETREERLSALIREIVGRLDLTTNQDFQNLARSHHDTRDLLSEANIEIHSVSSATFARFDDFRTT
ncbi:hypothetical protein CVT25_014700, partial [Psilocybe cyanescens]